MNRRTFLETSALGLAAGTLTFSTGESWAALPLKAVKQPIGFQSYVLRKEISEDIEGTLKQMKAYGYQHVEMCSPSGYQKFAFAPLVKYSGRELKQIITDAGLACESCHFTLPEMRDNLDDRLDFARQMGLKYFVCSGGLASTTLDEVKAKCAEMNRIGEKIAKAGFTTGYHNHNVEFEKNFDGKVMYDVLMEELNPDFVKMQFQVAVATLGYKAADYFRRYPGRFISAHLQDYDPNDYKKEVVLGQGIVDWKDFFEASKKGGLKVVYVEMESNPGTLKDSVTYLKNL
ncbi:sugar phosphate isomerase/epimerase family protein [Salmonirosea aquatica]|uniref:TIM barrel protein n=1 Tax=Salmonirosea aquatica TaxID=2654236 RepID=A0A7C9FY82_9BACT|nr:TIM barrel protein [Cytophagaceae bacterium SJW1-29]